ncbi:hypothetical protein CLU79DRAFT_780098 [Phycomyces nitens]|nr:hypothetical protein CLU79DRAFT_780098 [Phycomyces nitens]
MLFCAGLFCRQVKKTIGYSLKITSCFYHFYKGPVFSTSKEGLDALKCIILGLFSVFVAAIFF